MNQQRGIILGYAISESGELRKGDLVQRLDGYDNNFYTVIKVDERCVNGYYLRSRENEGELINFNRDELVKCHYSFFDYDAYFKRGVQVLLGAVKFEDILYIRAKKGNEMELGFSELDRILSEDILGMDFAGTVEERLILEDSDPYVPVATVLKYFKIVKPS